MWTKNQDRGIERTLWKLWEPLEYNLASLRINVGMLKFSGKDLTSDGQKMPKLEDVGR